ncbi:MAG: hypothetical protein AB1486_25605 [Planctomycetota bacterium]
MSSSSMGDDGPLGWVLPSDAAEPPATSSATLARAVPKRDARARAAWRPATNPTPLFVETEALGGMVLERLAERLFPHAVQVAPIAGADPLLSDLRRLCQLAERFGCGLAITTQGLALTRSRYESLRRVVSTIEVLVHSPRLDVWAFCGRERQFEKLVANLRAVAGLAREDGVRVGLSILPGEWSAAGAFEALDFAASVGVGSVTLLHLRPGLCHPGADAVSAAREAEEAVLAQAAWHARRLGLVLIGRDGARHPVLRDIAWAFPRDRGVPVIEALAARPGGGAAKPSLTVRISALGQVTGGLGNETLGSVVLVRGGGCKALADPPDQPLGISGT